MTPAPEMPPASEMTPAPEMPPETDGKNNLVARVTYQHSDVCPFCRR
jgi:hypothetical protein